MRSFPRINLQKGRSLVCLLTVSASKLKIYVLQRQFYVSIFFLWSKPLKIDQKKKNFPFAPFKRRPVKGQHFDSIGWGTDKSSHCWNQTKTSDCYWHFNASLIIRQSKRMKTAHPLDLQWNLGRWWWRHGRIKIQMISKWIWRLLKLSVHLKLVASFCAE